MLLPVPGPPLIHVTTMVRSCRYIAKIEAEGASVIGSDQCSVDITCQLLHDYMHRLESPLVPHALRAAFVAAGRLKVSHLLAYDDPLLSPSASPTTMRRVNRISLWLHAPPPTVGFM